MHIQFFFLPNGSEFGKYVIIFDAEMMSLVYIDNNKKNTLILCKVPTNGSNDTTLTPDKGYSINFTDHQEKFCLSLYYNGVKCAMFQKIFQFIVIVLMLTIF